ncbi:bifunctional glutathionylspermidine amidase/synthase [Babesia caballi]|uniref:Bifunctional glutathionylspermidine amidase/synthase n=1 Tax=Babesia caballi TaxID=5871 RepID=A0AAV4M2B2_BABCB|nr:bifunctional glutathionylspermidine amidase/synthase [Babesia caballi]
MQKSAGSNLGKLRFMQRGEKPQPKPVEVVERLLDEDCAWVIGGFEEVHKANCQPEAPASKSLKIKHATRKSFNGANPYIERFMQTLRKRR